MGALTLALCLSFQVAQAEADLGREGPLSNDTYVPTAEAAARHLERGDERLAQALMRELDPRLLDQAFDAWYAALSETAPGDCAPLANTGRIWSDPDHTLARRTEAVEVGILRRLAQVPPAARERWTARIDALALQALALAAGSPERLARVERDHPATPGACRAALGLFEIELERGRRAAARTYLRRAATHLAACGGRDGAVRTTLEQGLRSRREALGPAAGGVRTPTEEAWTRARSLRLVSSEIVAGRFAGRREDERAPARGILPSLSFLPEGALLARTRGVAMYRTAGGSLRPFLPGKWAEDLGWRVAEEFVTGSGSWRLDAASSGAPGAVLLHMVHGRAVGPLGNALLAVGAPDRGQAPELVWALSDQGALGPAAGRAREALGPGRFEFQPGPVVVDGVLLVQARRWELGEARDLEVPEELAAFLQGQVLQETRRVDEGQAEAWLLAFEARTGELLWKRFLARGSDLLVDTGNRFGPRTGQTAGAQPLALAEGGCVVSTGLGVTSLVEVADGRVAWTLRTRRRPPEAQGWSGSSPPPLSQGALLAAPHDSDHLYWLRPAADVEGGGLFARPPRAIGEALELVDGDAERALVLTRAGARLTFSRWGAEGRRNDAFYLPRSERFSGSALVRGSRALFASDRGLYLIDLERLYLLDRVALEAPPERRSDLAAGGSVFARGDRVYVLGEAVLWELEARPEPR